MKFTAQQIEEFRQMAAEWLTCNTSFNCNDVSTGHDAWTVARRSGITGQAYGDRAVVDAHIQTALEKIFPNAVFKDAKHY